MPETPYGQTVLNELFEQFLSLTRKTVFDAIRTAGIGEKENRLQTCGGGLSAARKSGEVAGTARKDLEKRPAKSGVIRKRSRRTVEGEAVGEEMISCVVFLNCLSRLSCLTDLRY